MSAQSYRAFPNYFRMIDGSRLNALFTGAMSFVANLGSGTVVHLATITSATIDGSTIGGTTPAAGTFTAINGPLGGTTPAAGSFTNLSTNGTQTQTPQLVAAAGSNSQSGANAITNSVAIITTVSATTRAVRLPAAATGKKVQLFNDATTTVKVYPGTGGSIGATSTNGAATIATRKGTVFFARNTTHWIAMAGA